MKHDKPHKSIDEQIELLRSRGLLIDDNANAPHYLHHLNYYRLAGYWLPFEENHTNHTFKKDICFNDVLNLYVFDRNLRLLILDAIERIEVSVRTHWAYYFAETYGPHAYLEPSLSNKLVWHEQNLALLNKEINRSEELFIKHYEKNYDQPPIPPIWAICEIMSFGLLSRFLRSLKPGDIRTKISRVYKLDYSVIISFIEHLGFEVGDNIVIAVGGGEANVEKCKE